LGERIRSLRVFDRIVLSYADCDSHGHAYDDTDRDADDRNDPDADGHADHDAYVHRYSDRNTDGYALA
jgi:hypothetical protein